MNTSLNMKSPVVGGVLQLVALACLVSVTGCMSPKIAVMESDKAGHPPFSEVERLHGHVCPGSAIGYRMACAAMDRIALMDISSSEVMAVVENNMCGTDSLQWVTDCTFGKGKIIFDDYGKNVYTLFSSKTRKGVRVVFLDDRIPGSVREDRDAFTQWILETPEDSILALTEVTVAHALPSRSKESVKCPGCGEGVTPGKMRNSRGQNVCIPCALDGQEK